MSSEWPRCPVSDLERAGVLLVQDGNHGENRPRRHEVDPAGTAHIRAADISDDGIIDFAAAQRINATALSRIRKGVGAPGDILLTHKGTVGRVARAPAHAPPFVCSPQTTFWRSLDDEQLDQGYLHAYLRSPGFDLQLRERMHESDMAPYVSLTAQRSFRIPMPPVPVQRAIGAIVETFDSKIESDWRLSGRLLDLARALVDEALLEDAVETTVGAQVEFHNRRRKPLSAAQRAEMQGDVPYYGATGVFDHVAESLFDEVLLLVGEDGSVVRPDETPVTQYIWGPAWVNNHAHVLTGSGISTELAALVIERARVASWVTGAVQPKLSMTNLRQVTIRVPGSNAAAGLEAAIAPLFSLVRGLAEEVKTLSALRDRVLPPLVDGTLPVPETVTVKALVTS